MLNKTITEKEIISKPTKVILFQSGRMESNFSLAKWSDFLPPLLYKQAVSSGTIADGWAVQI